MWSGCLVDQPFQERLEDGMIRCYFVHDEVVGFCRQWPRALMSPSSLAIPAAASAYEGSEAPAYASLKRLAESEWVPRMKELLGLDTPSLPAIWDADFFYGPKDQFGNDTFVLCEINVSAVWPFPEQAVEKLARAAVTRVAEATAS